MRAGDQAGEAVGSRNPAPTTSPVVCHRPKAAWDGDSVGPLRTLGAEEGVLPTCDPGGIRSLPGPPVLTPKEDPRDRPPRAGT